jgi:predicted Rossmann-fold nucleotide-binding protein
MLATTRPTLGVFASDKGPGDAERASIMSQVGSYVARKGARLVCLAEGDSLAVPLVTSARAAGGEVIVIADSDFQMPAALAGVPMERIAEAEMRMRRLAELCDVFVGLPGSLASATSLFSAWVKAGGGTGGRPVVLFNRNRAFEVMRGMAVDVLSHGIKRHDRYVQFTDSVEDLWNKVTWLINEAPKV